MPLALEQALGQKLMLSFAGLSPSAEILQTIAGHHIGGLTLFRALNAESPAQVHELTSALQAAARQAGQPPLLIGVDQEGGSLIAIPGTTPFPGNMALGATRSAELARKVGYAIGRELAALGVNVNYAPVCDVNINPRNPVVGPRSFSEDPALVGRLSAAMVEGLQAAGVAAAPKHFPGHGDAATDPHHGAPVASHDASHLRRIELPPFIAAVKAGAKMMMTAHIALPNFNDGSDLPATLSPNILQGLLRNDLGFKGVIVSDALDMHAIEQGPALIVEALAATQAGVDMLLLTTRNDQIGIYTGLLQAVRRSMLSATAIMASAERVLTVKRWLSEQPQPALDVVGCAEHQTLAAEIAERSTTLVCDTVRRLPLKLDPEARVAVILPRPQDLTPADTSSYERPALAAAVRAYHSNVEEIVVPINPSDSDVAAIRERAQTYELVIIGTINATEYPGQAALVNAILEQGTATVAVALRMPYDLQTYPTAPTYLCTYSLQPASMTALANALWGRIPFVGQLPVSISG